MCVCVSIYSQVHKYWDIDTILTFLDLYTHHNGFQMNEQGALQLQTVSFNWGYLHPNQVNGVGITTVAYVPPTC